MLGLAGDWRRMPDGPAFPSGNILLLLMWLGVAGLMWYIQTSQKDIAPFDPFAIMKLSPDATDKEIRKQYRELAKITHPDKACSLALRSAPLPPQTDGYQLPKSDWQQGIVSVSQLMTRVVKTQMARGAGSDVGEAIGRALEGTQSTPAEMNRLGRMRLQRVARIPLPLSPFRPPPQNLDDPKAAEKFDLLAKAYQALTDEVSKANWIKYGHPDGPQVCNRAPFSLPSWMAAVLPVGDLAAPDSLPIACECRR